MTYQILSAVAFALAICGNTLVNFKKRTGFAVWILSNIAWIAVNLIGETNVFQIAMFVVYMGLNVHRLIHWRNKKKGEDSK